MRKNALSLLVLVAFLTATLPVLAQHRLTREQARSLLQTALRLRGDKVTKKQIQETTDATPGYYNFGAYETPSKQSMQSVIGWFAVNQHTGQVWDTTTCETYAFPTLERQRRRMAHKAAKTLTKPPCAEGAKIRVVRKRLKPTAAEMPEVAQ